jgi:hypothetical protein
VHKYVDFINFLVLVVAVPNALRMVIRICDGVVHLAVDLGLAAEPKDEGRMRSQQGMPIVVGQLDCLAGGGIRPLVGTKSV